MSSNFPSRCRGEIPGSHLLHPDWKGPRAARNCRAAPVAANQFQGQGGRTVNHQMPPSTRASTGSLQRVGSNGSQLESDTTEAIVKNCGNWQRRQASSHHAAMNDVAFIMVVAEPLRSGESYKRRWRRIRLSSNIFRGSLAQVASKVDHLTRKFLSDCSSSQIWNTS